MLSPTDLKERKYQTSLNNKPSTVSRPQNSDQPDAMEDGWNLSTATLPNMVLLWKANTLMLKGKEDVRKTVENSVFPAIKEELFLTVLL